MEGLFTLTIGVGCLFMSAFCMYKAYKTYREIIKDMKKQEKKGE